MNYEFNQAIQTFNHAKQQQIYRTLNRPRNVPDLIVPIESYSSCSEDFIKAIGPKAFRKTVEDCGSESNFLNNGSMAIPSDFMRPDNPAIPEKVVILKIKQDRDMAFAPYSKGCFLLLLG